MGQESGSWLLEGSRHMTDCKEKKALPCECANCWSFKATVILHWKSFIYMLGCLIKTSCSETTIYPLCIWNAEYHIHVSLWDECYVLRSFWKRKMDIFSSSCSDISQRQVINSVTWLNLSLVSCEDFLFSELWEQNVLWKQMVKFLTYYMLTRC